MITAIHQPDFLPWIGFFHKALQAKTLVLFDDVLFPNSPRFGNRVWIKTEQGPAWLTVPIRHQHEEFLYNQAEIAGANWKKMLRTVEHNYRKAPHFDHFFSTLSSIFFSSDENLLGLNTRLIDWVLDELGDGPTVCLSSVVCPGPKVDGLEHILKILKAVGATEYISGAGMGSRRYVSEDGFVGTGIQLRWQDFKHPIYPQLHGSFVSGLSILDLLMNCGPDSRKVLLGETPNED